MNLHNTVAFFGVGFVMELMPRLVADAAVSETRALWLMVMGAVMMAVGGGYLVRMAWGTLPLEKYYASVRAIMQEEAEPGDAEAADKTRTYG